MDDEVKNNYKKLATKEPLTPVLSVTVHSTLHLGQDQRSWSLSRYPLKMDPGSTRVALDRDDNFRDTLSIYIEISSFFQ